MITLYIVPKFQFVPKYREAGDYYVLLPQDNFKIIVWEMWCSSLQWAVQDTYCYCDKILDEIFGKDNWEVMFKEKAENIDIQNPLLNIQEYQEKRAKYHLPEWEENKPDHYQFELFHI